MSGSGPIAAFGEHIALSHTRFGQNRPLQPLQVCGEGSDCGLFRPSLARLIATTSVVPVTINTTLASRAGGEQAILDLE